MAIMQQKLLTDFDDRIFNNVLGAVGENWKQTSSIPTDQGFNNTTLINGLENRSKLSVIALVIWHFTQATNKHCKQIIDLQGNLTDSPTVCSVWI